MPTERVVQVLGYIGANTLRLRQQRGVTQERLAELADLDLRFIQRIERAARNLSIGVLVPLADALGVDPRELLAPAELLPARRGRPKKPTAPRIGPTRK